MAVEINTASEMVFNTILFESAAVIFSEKERTIGKYKCIVEEITPYLIHAIYT